MSITITGTLTDVTSQPVDAVTTATVKAPTARIGSGSGIISSSPAKVEIGDSGEVTISGLAAGLSWLYLEGPGWSDSIALAAAEGMTTLVEAIANAAGVPGFIDYLKLIADIDKAANAAVDKITSEITTKFVGYPEYGSKILRTDEAGKLVLSSGSITNEYDVVNKRYVDSASFVRGKLTADHNLDVMWSAADAGVWQCMESPTAEALGLPEPGIGSLVVLYAAGSAADYYSATQIWVPTRSGKLYTRSRVSNKEWSEWASSSSDAFAPAGASSGRENLLAMSRGGKIGTGGKAVVSLRFDHNMAAFDKNIKPRLLERGLPATMPCFYNMIVPQPGYTNDDSAAAGKTWDDVQQNFYRGVEVFSHSYSHQDAASVAAITKEVSGSRTALEEAMPDVRVHGWAMPGVTGTQYLGWWQAWVDPETRMQHPAGQLLGSTYGTYNVSGYGLNELGKAQSRYFGIESNTTAATAKSHIDRAIATTTGVTLMCHPNKIGTDGYMPLAVFEEILDYIVAKRDAGEIMVLTMGGQAVADPSTGWRHSLTPKVSGWSGGPTGTLSTTANLSYLHDSGGGMRELAATVTGTGSVKLRVQAANGTVPMDVYRTFTIEDGGTAHLPVGIPRRSTTLQITAEASGVTITDIGLYAI
ncbi:polysaccharide deacetylase family protein [Corynebacterium guaraldiae]